MALKLEDKKVIVAEVNEAAGNALSAVVADYRGMEVGALTEMREKARNGKIYLRVVQNTMHMRDVHGKKLNKISILDNNNVDNIILLTRSATSKLISKLKNKILSESSAIF